MRGLKTVNWLVLVALMGGGAVRGTASSYDQAVLQANPVLYLTMSSQSGGETDRTVRGHQARYYPANSSRRLTRMPNGDNATVFDGYTQYLEILSRADLSVRRGGGLTLEAWVRPDTLQFPSAESDGYVHWMGKGESGQHEYAARMYSKNNSAGRPSRISGYAFNLQGGLGSGSYFQDAVSVGEWIHVAIVIQTRTRPGTIAIYKNGVLRKNTSLAQFDVTPQAGNAPLRVGTRDLQSFFKGAVGKVAVYAYPLPEATLQSHTQLMH